MNACISVVCYKSKTLSNGENPLMLQISKGGKRKYQSLGISVLPRYWDFTRNKPKPNCPNKEYIQKIILDKQTELQQRMLDINRKTFCDSFPNHFVSVLHLLTQNELRFFIHFPTLLKGLSKSIKKISNHIKLVSLYIFRKLLCSFVIT